ncbi:hypothetical protein QN277_018550 [Acacia crassicarpa]|uniref:AT hook motif-containing protein n=1 Tax=Acacia crassicarpa TaxID=499986 RepID=A0AAE1JWR6_9FABA|nr:hypothetical protein QN277_018550 [Acacia crassicarpa]
MDQPNPNDNCNSSGDIPLKRKRGRPRKYPKPYAEENAHIPNIQNLNRNPVSGGNASVPPGFDRVNGSQLHRRDLGSDLNDPMVGQVVSCVIEAVFDAGYLLSAKVGNSNTTLRGLVLKPGHYAPISAENDVAPSVPMIQRNEIPFPTGTRVKNPHRRERNKHYVNVHRNADHMKKGSHPVNHSSGGAVSSSDLVASRGNNQQSMEKQTSSLLSRGTVVPVTLQPVNLQNGVMLSNQSSPQVMTQASLGSTPSVAKEILAEKNKMPFSQTLTTQNLFPRGMQNEDGLLNLSSAEVQSKVEAKSTRQPGLPFENLVSEVVRRVEAPSESIDTTDANNNKSVEKMSIKDSTSGPEEKVNGVGQPLLIKPLQAVQTVSVEHSASASRPSGNSEAGEKIDQSQDNIIENQPLQAEETVSGNKSDSNFKGEPDEKTGHAA